MTRGRKQVDIYSFLTSVIKNNINNLPHGVSEYYMKKLHKEGYFEKIQLKREPKARGRNKVRWVATQKAMEYIENGKVPD